MQIAKVNDFVLFADHQHACDGTSGLCKPFVGE